MRVWKPNCIYACMCVYGGGGDLSVGLSMGAYQIVSMLLCVCVCENKCLVTVSVLKYDGTCVVVFLKTVGPCAEL